MSEAAPSTAPVIPPVPAGHTQLYVRNLAWATTEETLRNFVKSAVGVDAQAVEIVRTKSGPSAGRSKGFGFITVVSEQSAALLSKLSGAEVDGRPLEAAESKPRDPDAPPRERRPRQPRQPRQPRETQEAAPAQEETPRPAPVRKSFPDATQLYVNQLAPATTEDELAALFEAKLGAKPIDTEIIRSKLNGRSRGFGFVFVPNARLADALAVSGSTLGESVIGVAEARTDLAPRRPRRGPRGPRRRGPRRPAATQEGETGEAQAQPEETNQDAPNNRRRRGNGRGRGRGRRRGPRSDRPADANAAAPENTQQ